MRVVLADDHCLIADALRAVLSNEFEVVGVASDGRALVDLARELKPDVVVTDIFMPMLNGLDAGRMIRVESPESRIVFLTMNPDPDLAAAAIRMGANGYLLKNSAGAELISCLRIVGAGGQYVTKLIHEGDVDDLLMQSEEGEESTLSSREKEVLQLLAEGNSMKQVAALLAISARTVQFHKYRIMSRFRLKSSAELVQFAMRNRVV